MTVAILVVPSVTKLPPEADGAVVVGGSHAALYAAHVIAKAGARAAIHHDAGIGFEEAGVAGLALAQELGMAMAAVDSASARIGEAEDMMRRGIVSRANALAAACGVAPGQTCAEAAERLKAAPWPHRAPPARAEDAGRSVFEAKAGQRKIVCIDSATMIATEDHDQVVATGSHGAEPSGQVVAPVRPALVLYNDAGFGADRCGRGRPARSRPSRHCRRHGGGVVGEDRRGPLDPHPGRPFRRERSRIPARRPCRRLGPCVGPPRGRKSRLSIAGEKTRTWPSST